MYKNIDEEFDPKAEMTILEPGINPKSYTHFVSFAVTEESGSFIGAKYGNFTVETLPYLLVGAIDLINRLVEEVNSSPIKEKIALSLAAMDCKDNVLNLVRGKEGKV